MDLDAQRGARLLEERKRLGWSQQTAADTAGIRREMWARYEGGSEPGAKGLAGIAAAGADVLYILTGQRNPTMPALDAAEQVLLDSYRRCKPEARVNLIQTAALLSAGLSSGGISTDRTVTQTIRAAVSGGVAGGNIINKGKGKS